MRKSNLLSLIGRLKSKLLSKPLTLSGLMFGFIGAVLLAYSVEIIDPWLPPHALNHITIIQGYFSSGVILLAVGFVLQFLGVCLEE